MPQIMPIKELRNTSLISEKCHSNDEPIYITKNGYGDLVVMSIETYEKLLGDSQIDLAIAESEAQIANGEELIDADEAFRTLREKHFG